MRQQYGSWVNWLCLSEVGQYKEYKTHFRCPSMRLVKPLQCSHVLGPIKSKPQPRKHPEKITGRALMLTLICVCLFLCTARCLLSQYPLATPPTPPPPFLHPPPRTISSPSDWWLAGYRETITTATILWIQVHIWDWFSFPFFQTLRGRRPLPSTLMTVSPRV